MSILLELAHLKVIDDNKPMIEGVVYGGLDVAQRIGEAAAEQPYSTAVGGLIGVAAGIPILAHQAAPSDDINAKITGLHSTNTSLSEASVVIAQDAPVTLKSQAQAILNSRIHRNDMKINELQAKDPGKGSAGEVAAWVGIEAGLVVTGAFALTAISRQVRRRVMPRWYTFRASIAKRNVDTE